MLTAIMASKAAVNGLPSEARFTLERAARKAGSADGGRGRHMKGIGMSLLRFRRGRIAISAQSQS